MCNHKTLQLPSGIGLEVVGAAVGQAIGKAALAIVVGGVVPIVLTGRITRGIVRRVGGVAAAVLLRVVAA